MGLMSGDTGSCKYFFCLRQESLSVCNPGMDRTWWLLLMSYVWRGHQYFTSSCGLVWGQSVCLHHQPPRVEQKLQIETFFSETPIQVRLVILSRKGLEKTEVRSPKILSNLVQ